MLIISRLGSILLQTPVLNHFVYRMSSDVHHTNRIKFGRVNEQLNYKRKFISKHKADVTIPTIPYEGFDVFSPGTKVKPWSLMELITSARLFTQWPAAKADSPEDSFLDAHKLLTVPGQAIYFVGIRLDISREFNDFNTPKFPLIVHQELTYVGKASARKEYILKHPDMDVPFVHCYFDDVLIDKATGKGTPFPTWWKDKYSFVNDLNEKPVMVKPDLPNYQEVFENTYKVEFDDLDHNLHTTSSSYLRYCFNAIFTNIKGSKYKNMSMESFNSGSRSIVMQFLQETRHGELLTVMSWEDQGEVNTLHFSIAKEDRTRCCYVKIEFYDTEDKEQNSKL